MDNQNYSNPTKQPILPNENTFNDYDRINDVLLCLKSLLSDYTTFIIECSHQQLANKLIDIQKEVIAAVKEISSKYKIGYSDIAVLFPYKQHSLVKYYFMYWLTQALDKEGIPYSLITSSDDEPFAKKKFSETTGVVVSTIDSSLGLDFKAVIFTGLYPYNFVFGDKGHKVEIKSWSTIKRMSDEDQTKVQSQMRSMYTACSRARDVLYVLSDLKVGSPMEEILKK